MAHKVEIPGLEHPLPLFRDYLRRGYYPFALEDDFDIRLRQIINLTLESDIPQFADMNVATGRKLKQLLAIIAKSVPFRSRYIFFPESVLRSPDCCVSLDSFFY